MYTLASVGINVFVVQEEHMDIWRNNVDAILQVTMCVSFECDATHAYPCLSASILHMVRICFSLYVSLQNGFLRHRHERTVKQSLYRRLMRSNH